MDEERDSSEDFEITVNEEEHEEPRKQLKPREGADLLEAYEIDVDSITDKPWNKPGADITDYFNYGFSEATWRQYMDKQKSLREEYGKKRVDRRPRKPPSPERRGEWRRRRW
jgi:pre-mRNA 3'-end-processing factor FIP1